jgi:hypothetical protein
MDSEQEIGEVTVEKKATPSKTKTNSAGEYIDFEEIE